MHTRIQQLLRILLLATLMLGGALIGYAIAPMASRNGSSPGPPESQMVGAVCGAMFMFLAVAAIWERKR